jgi:hypothetical protein
MMSYFMTKNDMEPQIISRFNTVSRYFLDLLNQVLMRAGANKDKVQVYSQAFFASLTGIIMAFRNYPGRSREEKRRQIHKLALLIAAVFRKGMDTA